MSSGVRSELDLANDYTQHILVFYWKHKIVIIGNSLGQRCSHVGALLFILHDITTMGLAAVPCTSKLCTWSKPRSVAIEPQPLRLMSFERPKIESGII
jgi:hypothetical protein